MMSDQVSHVFEEVPAIDCQLEGNSSRPNLGSCVTFILVDQKLEKRFVDVGRNNIAQQVVDIRADFSASLDRLGS
jgi:hypothetical protein